MPRQRKLPKGMVKRGDAYYSAFRAGGRLVRKRLSSDFKTATELLNDLHRADKADYGQVDNDLPWAELKAEFLRRAGSPSVGRATMRPTWRVRIVRIDQQRAQVSQAHVLAYREWRLASDIATSQKVKPGQARRPTGRKVSPRTVNREVGTISNMLNKGVEWRRIGFNPLVGLEPLRHDKPVKQRRPLALAEVVSMFEASPAYLKPVWRMFMCTGIRRNELASLLFSDIDFDRQTVTVRAENAKSKKAREIPLDDTMLAMLREIQAAAKDRQPVPGKTPAETAAQAANFSRSTFSSLGPTPPAAETCSSGSTRFAGGPGSTTLSLVAPSISTPCECRSRR